MESSWSDNTWIWSIGPTSATLAARLHGFEPDNWIVYNNAESGFATVARFGPVTGADDSIFFTFVNTEGLPFPYGLDVEPDVHT